MPQPTKKQPIAPTSQPSSPMLSKFLKRFGVMVSLVGALHFYLASRVLSNPRLSTVGVVAGAVFFSLAFLSLPMGMLGMFFRQSAFTKSLRVIGNHWLGAFFLLFSLTVATDLIRLVAPFAFSIENQGDIIVIGGLLLITLALLNGLRDPRVVRIKVSLPGLGSGLRGFRIVQISDMHVGQPGTDRAFVERLVENIAKLQPDAIAITGDSVEGSLAMLRETVAPLAKLSAPHGVYYVTGNHEYYHGGSAWEAHFAELGLTVLDNACHLVERDGSQLAIGGIPDYTAALFDPNRVSSPERAFATAPPVARVPRILLAHQPRDYTAAAAAGVVLQLSGHTHGGQIVPFNFLVRLQQPVAAGLKKLGNVQVYTHPGTGYWGPRMRLGTRSEITELTLE